MTFQEELELAQKIINFVAEAPENLEKVIRIATQAQIRRMVEVRAHAVDMETVASMALNQKLFKGNENFIADKLEKWKHMNGLRWDDQIERLRK